MVTINPVNDIPIAVNDIPIAVNDSAVTNEDNTVVIDPRVNDTDDDADSLSISAITQAVNGTVSFSATSVTYTANAILMGSIHLPTL
ncbi:MAG: hypothetical protein HRT88_13330 [Lentisphaeraceae bacterium]|nr:hypothetical protein [Lentisphaeraceae bacterium]